MELSARAIQDLPRLTNILLADGRDATGFTDETPQQGLLSTRADFDED
jgi:hypothetical protein